MCSPTPTRGAIPAIPPPQQPKTPNPLPHAGPDLKTYSKMLCALLDIPVYENPVESLHVLFTLYLEFKNNPVFRQHMDMENRGLEMEGAGSEELMSSMGRATCAALGRAACRCTDVLMMGRGGGSMHLVLDIQDRLAGCLMVKMVRVGPGCPAHCARAGCCVRLSGWLDAPLTRAHSSPGAVCAGGRGCGEDVSGCGVSGKSGTPTGQPSLADH